MKFQKIIIGSLSLLSLASCSDKMNYNEYNIYDKDYISKTFANVGGFMTNIYNAIDYDYGSYGSATMGSATDESEYAIPGGAIEDFYNGAWSPTNAKSSMWTNMYQAINVCNQVTDKFQGLKFEDYELNSDYDAQMARYKNYEWEARLWRAYFYFNLVKQYGGVPLITKVQSASVTNSMSRASSDSVFQFILGECDAIKDSIVDDPTSFNLPSEVDNGRADRLTVLALKARAALYWASPLFNPSNDKERWHKAALYNKELLDAAAAKGKTLANDYASLWATDNYQNAKITCEIIFGRRIYGSGTNGSSNTFESRNYPAGLEGGVGGNCPTQNLVDAYEMKSTGKPIDAPGSGYNSSNMYADRDPRLDATVAKNGDVWPTYQKVALQTYYGGTNGEPISGGTPTGYYIKKLCHGAIDLTAKSKYKTDNHTWVVFRLGEFYLNYAEAVFKYLGSADATSAEFPMSAREAASKTRVRAGMPAFPESMSNADFWKEYTNERFVELAFENHRFWDVRRWKEADQYFKNIKELKITKGADGTLSYQTNIVTRQWDDKMYLFPIPVTEILKNHNLKQNPGWE